MKYNAFKLKTLERDAPEGKSLILEYKEPGDYTFKGIMVTAYVSMDGRHCANIGSFTKSIFCEHITGHSYQD